MPKTAKKTPAPKKSATRKKLRVVREPPPPPRSKTRKKPGTVELESVVVERAAFEAGLRENVALRAELAQCKRELAHETAHGLARFALIESVLKQRDVWQKMFIEQSLEHSSAQEMLTGNLAEAVRVIKGLVDVVNQDRQRHGEPALVFDKTFEGLTVKKRFDELVAELLAAAPKDIDGIAERAQIDAQFAAERATVAMPEAELAEMLTPAPP